MCVCISFSVLYMNFICFCIWFPVWQLAFICTCFCIWLLFLYVVFIVVYGVSCVHVFVYGSNVCRWRSLLYMVVLYVYGFHFILSLMCFCKVVLLVCMFPIGVSYMVVLDVYGSIVVCGFIVYLLCL